MRTSRVTCNSVYYRLHCITALIFSNVLSWGCSWDFAQGLAPFSDSNEPRFAVENMCLMGLVGF